MPIDLSLTAENLLVQASVRDFVAREITPHIGSWDQDHVVPRPVFDRMAALGYLGAPIWERWGGSGMDHTSLGILCEELERADTAFRVVMSVHVALNSLTLMQWASPEQQRRWLVPQARGEKLATFGLTEPGAGTDVASIATMATRDGDSYILQGTKLWISLADIADHSSSSRPWIAPCVIGGSPRSSWSVACPACPRAPSRAGWASTRATREASRSSGSGCPSSSASARRGRASPSR